MSNERYAKDSTVERYIYNDLFQISVVLVLFLIACITEDGRGVVLRNEYIDDCYKAKTRLPPKPYATWIGIGADILFDDVSLQPSGLNSEEDDDYFDIEVEGDKVEEKDELGDGPFCESGMCIDFYN
jgi:hypothetical protein